MIAAYADANYGVPTGIRVIRGRHEWRPCGECMKSRTPMMASLRGMHEIADANDGVAAGGAAIPIAYCLLPIP